MKGRIVVDSARCVGCLGCEIACNQINQLPPGNHWIHVASHGPVEQNGRLFFEWRVTVDDGCDLCGDRTTAGLPPACVQHCIAGCIELV